MLAIRMQRTGRKGYAQFRIIVQEARRTPTSGAIVAQLGHYNPHAKEVFIDKEKVSFYLDHGAQPSESIARLLKKEGVKMPAWVKLAADKARPIRHGDKLRKNRPAEPSPSAKATEDKQAPAAKVETAAPGDGPVETEVAAPETEAEAEPATTGSSANPEAAIEAEPPAEAPEVVQETEAKVEPEAVENTKTTDKPAK